MPLDFSLVTQTTDRDLPRLFDVWEASVRATHLFLDEAFIQKLIPLVRVELENFSPIYCVRDTDGSPFAFIGVKESKIEMLFVHAQHRGRGAGALLSKFAIQVLGADSVDVNEQNELAVGFYKHLGFHQVGRSPVDPQGLPMLHMALHKRSTAR